MELKLFGYVIQWKNLVTSLVIDNDASGFENVALKMFLFPEVQLPSFHAKKDSNEKSGRGRVTEKRLTPYI